MALYGKNRDNINWCIQCNPPSVQADCTLLWTNQSRPYPSEPFGCNRGNIAIVSNISQVPLDARINSLSPSDAYMRQWTRSSLIQMKACRLIGENCYPNQWWNIVNWTIGTDLIENFKRNSYIFIHENPFENVEWLMAAVLSLSECVDPSHYNHDKTMPN